MNEDMSNAIDHDSGWDGHVKHIAKICYDMFKFNIEISGCPLVRLVFADALAMFGVPFCVHCGRRQSNQPQKRGCSNAGFVGRTKIQGMHSAT